MGKKTESLSSFSSHRFFQLWSYTVSHGQLLLFSTKTKDDPTRIEILFKNIAYVALPKVLDGLRIEVVEASALPEYASRDFGSRLTYRVSNSLGICGYVVAGGVFTHSDDKEYDEPSALVEDMGSE